MKIFGLLGSPRVSGKCSMLLQRVLDGAADGGAEVKRFDLIKCNVQHCMGCCKCMFDDPGQTIGRCPLQDDVRGMLEEYISSDGYVFASPVYDGSVTSLMKKFLERKIALTHRAEDAYATIGAARTPADFKKKAVMIVTGNCADEYREVMGDPCFEMMEGHLMIEQIETIEKQYVGSVENIDDTTWNTRLQTAYQTGKSLVEAIRAE